MDEALGGSLAPRPLTIDRLDGREELIVAQSTSQCCRCCCFQPSINWVLAEGNNFVPGTNPFELDSVGWIHEESSFCGRWWSWIIPGCRSIKYVQHSGPAPPSIMGENQDWFTCQFDEATTGLDEADRQANIVATHEKNCTCGTCWMWPIPFPICNCLPLPYLETRNGSQTLGKTVYVCDACCFVPKFDVYNGSNENLYRIRPDTCVAGLCVRCRCCEGKKGGKCCRIPFIIRTPQSLEPVEPGPNVNSNSTTSTVKAMIDILWAGWKHECCTQKNAYHVVFPRDITKEEKLVLLGSTVLVDVAMFEQDGGDDAG